MSLVDTFKGTFRKNRPTSITEQQVRSALAQVIDPDLGRDIVSLGFVRNVKIADGRVAFDVNLTTPACPVKDQLKQQCEAVVGEIPGVSAVVVTMTASPPKAKATGLSALADVGAMIAVASGKGGVGKSTVAVNLACSLACKGARVGLLDADVYGPSIPLMMSDQVPRDREGSAIVPPEVHGVKFISAGMFASANQAAMLRGPMVANVVKQFLSQVHWGELDYLVIDYPPGTGDIQLTISQTASLTGALVVTTPQEVALTDVRKAIQMFKKLNVPVLGVLETMSYFAPPGSSERYHIFGKGGGERIAREFGIAFLGGLPIDPKIAEGGDRSKPFVLAEQDSTARGVMFHCADQIVRQAAMLTAQAQGLAEFHLEWQ